MVKKYLIFLAVMAFIVGPGVVMYHTIGDVTVQCVISEPGVAQEHEVVEQHTIAHSSLISVSTAKDEAHSTVVFRNMSGTQFASYPGICKVVR